MTRCQSAFCCYAGTDISSGAPEKDSNSDLVTNIKVWLLTASQRVAVNHEKHIVHGSSGQRL